MPIIIVKKYLNDLSFKPLIFEQEIAQYAAENEGANLINQKDEDGCTLGHHVAMRSGRRGNLALPLEILFKHGLDCSIQDKNGNTPLHIAVEPERDKERDTMLRMLIEYAAKTKFNFSLSNNEGLSVLHMAAIEPNYYDSMRISRYSIQYILCAARENNLVIEFDKLSRSGSTALYYLISHLRLNEAEMLLEAGADPAAHGETAFNKNPILKLEGLVSEGEAQLSTPRELSDYSDTEIERVGEIVEKLKSLKPKMLKAPSAPLVPSGVLFGSSPAFFSTDASSQAPVLTPAVKEISENARATFSS